nr:immunoglobulin heavy chain junction region [Mus musculus]
YCARGGDYDYFDY